MFCTLASSDDCQGFLLWRSKSKCAEQAASECLTLPCANTDKMVPMEVLMYEPEHLCFSKVADFYALFNPFVTVR